MTPIQPTARPLVQRGAALITSLIILLVLTVLGVAAMSSSSLEELMAGNLRDQAMALDAAEAALRDGERLIESWGGTRPIASSDTSAANPVFQMGVFFDPNVPGDDFDNHAFDTAVWGTTSDPTPSRLYSRTGLGVSQQPRFVIEELGDVGGPADWRAGIHRAGITMYRVTARGTGLSNNSVVLLQTTYGKRY